jgi:hypothetical protein
MSEARSTFTSISSHNVQSFVYLSTDAQQLSRMPCGDASTRIWLKLISALFSVLIAVNKRFSKVDWKANIKFTGDRPPVLSESRLFYT